MLMLPIGYAGAQNPKDYFQEDSYWVMEYTDFDGNVQSVYHVYLELDHRMVHIVDDTGTDYTDMNFGWSYDYQTGLLKIDALEDGWNSGLFSMQDGTFLSGGTYHNTRLTPCADKQLYNDRLQTFRMAYGSRHFGERLKKLTTYLDFALWNDPTFPYDSFRYYAMFKVLGVVVEENGNIYDLALQEILPLVGAARPNNCHVESVLADIFMPEENKGQMSFNQQTVIVNLAYTDIQQCYDAFNTLSSSRDVLLHGKATESYACANDVFSAWADGNADQFVVICQMPFSVTVFRGPNGQVKQILNSLGMGPLLEQ